MRINDKRKVSGFTLIEILISMFVFAYGIMSVVSFMGASYKRTFKVKKLTSAARTFSYIENYLDTIPINSSVLNQGGRYLSWNTIFGTDSVEKTNIYNQLGRPKYPPIIFVLDYSPSAGKLFKIVRIYIYDNLKGWYGIPYETYSRGS